MVYVYSSLISSGLHLIAPSPSPYPVTCVGYLGPSTHSIASFVLYANSVIECVELHDHGGRAMARIQQTVR